MAAYNYIPSLRQEEGMRFNVSICICVLQKPDRDEWGSALDAMQAALALEKTVNQSLLDMHKIASSHVDPQMCDWIEQHYLTEQVESIKSIADHITQLKRCGPGLGEYVYDKHTMQS